LPWVSLSLDGLSVHFGGLHAVDNVTIEFSPGSMTGLVGPNGSGKTTTVNAVSGIVRPTAGRVMVGGIDITGARPDVIVRHGLARTWQIPRMPGELTVAEVISVPITYASGRKTHGGHEWDLANLLDICGLGSVGQAFCRNLSVTDLRRLEIARALACAPRVLLLDEAMAGLSLEDSHTIIELIRRIRDLGVTIVVVEHVMRIITTLCTHVVVLNEGRVLAHGAPEEVLVRPDVREAYLGKGFAL
jgi:branched-chain amino acid transport system ATP-binding protein